MAVKAVGVRVSSSAPRPRRRAQYPRRPRGTASSPSAGSQTRTPSSHSLQSSSQSLAVTARMCYSAVSGERPGRRSVTWSCGLSVSNTSEDRPLLAPRAVPVRIGRARHPVCHFPGQVCHPPDTDDPEWHKMAHISRSRPRTHADWWTAGEGVRRRQPWYRCPTTQGHRVRALRTCRTRRPAASMYGQGDVAKRSKAEVCKTSIRRFESARRLHTPPHLQKSPILAEAPPFVTVDPMSVVCRRSPDAPTPPEQACRAHLELPVCVGYRPLGVVRAGVRVFPDVANSRRRAEAVHG